MTVRRHVPLPLRFGTLALAAAAGAAGGAWVSQVAIGGAAATAPAAAAVAPVDSEARIDQVAAERRDQQIKALEAENAELKADLAYLKSLLPAADAQGPVAIRRFQVERDAGTPGRMRYRALLMQAGTGRQAFSGSLQLRVTLVSDDRTATLVLPDDGPSAAPERMRLSFKRLLRVEGHFQIPAGAVPKSVQLRVLEKGALRAEQTVSL